MTTQKRLKELFDYQDGQFINRKTNAVKALVPITKHHRYCRVIIDGKAYAFHRIVFLYHNLELAGLVAVEARDKYHGEFACH